MRIHYFIHADFEKLGAIKEWANQRGHILKETNTYRGEKLPEVDEFDFLIIMGGPQNACQIADYPYLENEVQLIKQAITSRKIVLGVCLGAQLIAEALGGKTQPSPQREVGVFPITLTAAAQHDAVFKDFPAQFPVMHWHNDMPGLTSDMVLLATSEGCPCQAFRYDDHVYGLQFHCELTQNLVASMIDHCGNDLQAAQFVKSPDKLLLEDFSMINQKMHIILDRLVCQFTQSEKYDDDFVFDTL